MDTAREMEAFIERLKNSEKIIIVEGAKDKRALESLGIKNIVTLKQPLHEVIDYVSENAADVIILTDLDRHGKELFGKLSSGLQAKGVRIDKAFREFLFRKTKLRQIEGIGTYLENHANH